MKNCLPTGLLIIVAMVPWRAPASDAAVSYSRDVRPLLAKKCFSCHGPDEASRAADLRLDSFEGATAELNGTPAIVPGSPDASELIRRVTSADPDEVMPPSHAGAPLDPKQIELLRNWIEAGGAYQQHWAFEPLTSPVPPTVPETKTANPIDAFISQRLAAVDLSLAPPADKYTLIRRTALDLTGLPPTADDIERFVNDRRPNAFQRMVDRFLASPQYGERWTRVWLDLARYADSNGYEKDRPRSIWPYRDWVLQAINDDLPYDQFSIAQLAGDLLPDASQGDRVATGFHRNTMLNEEGGIDPLEYRYYAMVDRTLTTGTVWLGLSIGCAQCHSHKYDPISHEDYFRLMALLNNADEPELRVHGAEIAAQQAELERKIQALEAELPSKFPAIAGNGPEEERVAQGLQAAFETWVHGQHQQSANWQPIRPAQMETNLPKLELLPDASIYSSGDITKRDVFQLRFDLGKELDPATRITGLRIEALPDDRLPAGGPGRCYYEGRRGDFFLSEVVAQVDQQKLAFASASIDYGKLSIGSGQSKGESVFDGEGSTGWSTSGREGQRSQLVLQFADPLPATGILSLELLFERHFAASLGRFRISVTADQGELKALDVPPEVERVLSVPSRTWTKEQTETALAHFLRIAPEIQEARQPIEKLRRSMPEFPTTMVMQERPADNPRRTYRHHRGEYLNPREEIHPGLPALFERKSDKPVQDRLALARWLVSSDNPLAGRVFVNRAWQAFFGTGIVASSDDLGTQAPSPTHPELLDWLADDTLRHQWSTKHLHREIVTSHSYAQESHWNEAQTNKNPTNELVGRGPRFRLEAEMVRDQALAVSGLLTQRLGGPSVKPPQPAAVTDLAYGNEAWQAATGADRFRRSLYTYSKRTSPFAAYATFDAPSGENCIVRRDRSNTPLQSLTLLNDAMYLEAARELGRLAVEYAHDPKEKAKWLWQRVLVRPAEESELQSLLDFVASQQLRLENKELNAAEICSRQEADALSAAWVLAARAVLNLDETISKP